MNNNNGKNSPVYFYNEGNNKTHTQSVYPEHYTYYNNTLADKLSYNYFKNIMDLEKNACHLQQKLDYEKQLMEIKAKNDAEKQLTYSEIYKNKEDRLVYIICKPDGKSHLEKELFKERGFESFIYYSSYPQLKQLLCVSWDYNKHILCTSCNVKATVFLRRLNSNGLNLLLSERTKKTAAFVLLEYFINNAKRCEIPFNLGWWKDCYKNWHFAVEGDLNLKELSVKSKSDDFIFNTDICSAPSYNATEQRLKRTMDSKNFTTNILQILVSVGINYPVIKDIYPVLNKPIIVIVNPGNMEAAKDILSDEGTPKLDSFLSFKKFGEILNSVNSDLVLYPFTQTQKGTKFLEIITSTVVTGSLDGNSFNALPVVVSESIPYGCNLNDFFIVFIDEELTDIPFDRMCVVPPEDNLPVIYDKFCHVSADATHDEMALLAAACFLYPFYRDSGLEEEFPALLDCARKLVELDENNHDIDNICDFFVIELYKWQERTCFNSIFELPNLEMAAVQMLDEAMFFDNKYIYMCDRLFKEISLLLLNTISVNILKDVLANEGFLCPDNTHTRTYTNKMFYYNIVGNPCRARMLRFSREKLDRTGEASFVDICKSSNKNRPIVYKKNTVFKTKE